MHVVRAAQNDNAGHCRQPLQSSAKFHPYLHTLYVICTVSTLLERTRKRECECEGESESESISGRI